MKHSLEVCLITIALAVPHSAAQLQTARTPAQVHAFLQTGITTPILKKGISVKLPVTRNAVLVPDADKEDALVVAISRDGKLYFGIDPITPAALTQKLKVDFANSPEKKLYLKGDAGARYASVVKVLEAAHSAGVTAPVLLTSQQKSPQPRRPVVPQGMGVLLGSPPSSGANPVLVQLLSSGRQSPALKIDHQSLAWTGLRGKLSELVQSGGEKVVLLKASGQLPFADVVRVIDSAHSMGAKVFLQTRP